MRWLVKRRFDKESDYHNSTYEHQVYLVLKRKHRIRLTEPDMECAWRNKCLIYEMQLRLRD